MWCLFRGVWQRDRARLAAAIGYAFSLGFWIVAPKPVQFYYHYFVPSFFLLAALALTCSDLRHCPRGKWLAWGIPAASVLVFAGFFPIIAALPLADGDSYKTWAWVRGWR